jgi:hypothetical protein
MKRTKGGKGMKKKLGMSLFVMALAVLWGSPGICLMEEPPAPNPNGFISGPHYNLNIIGKKDGFVCPEKIYDEFGKEIYGNVIFVPEVGSDIKINMQSGKGTRFATQTELQVLDPCTLEPDYTPGDDFAATLQLPKSEKGYWVFARALAKPGTDGSRNMDFLGTGVTMVQDDANNDLWYLGSLTSDGTVCKNTDGEEVSCSLIRSKGQSKAINVTQLFQWTGDVCYFDQTDALADYTTKQLCCSVDSTDVDQDGITGEYYDCSLVTDPLTCVAPQVLVNAYCSVYTQDWVFNIADFVQYFWSLDNSGVKLVQVRFYPIP